MSNFVQLEINKRSKWVYFHKNRWVAHVGYWMFVFLVGTLMRTTEPLTFSLILNSFLLSNLMIACFFYLYCLVLIPYFFKRNKYLEFWLLVISGYLIITATDVFFGRAFVHLDDQTMAETNKSFLSSYLENLYGFLYNFLFFSIMLFFMEKNEESSTLLELEKEKKEIEQVKLDFLKTNISPDFILRSLHQLKVSAKVPEESTPEAILTFSDLLRYRLYRGRQSQSPLKEELSAVTSFVHFIGFDHQLRITFNVQGAAEDKQLAPLALVNLLEPFCKILNETPVMLDIIILIETEELLMEMNYGANAGPELIADLEAYRENYMQLNGDGVKFHFEQSEENSFKVNLSLPLFNS